MSQPQPGPESLIPSQVDVAVEMLRRAVQREGTNQRWHRLIMGRHRAEWPTLWHAIDHLLAAQRAQRLRE